VSSDAVKEEGSAPEILDPSPRGYPIDGWMLYFSWGYHL